MSLSALFVRLIPAIGAALDKHHCSIVIARWQAFSGETAEKVKG